MSGSASQDKIWSRPASRIDLTVLLWRISRYTQFIWRTVSASRIFLNNHDSGPARGGPLTSVCMCLSGLSRRAGRSVPCRTPVATVSAPLAPSSSNGAAWRSGTRCGPRSLRTLRQQAAPPSRLLGCLDTHHMGPTGLREPHSRWAHHLLRLGPVRDDPVDGRPWRSQHHLYRRPYYGASPRVKDASLAASITLQACTGTIECS